MNRLPFRMLLLASVAAPGCDGGDGDGDTGMVSNESEGLDSTEASGEGSSTSEESESGQMGDGDGTADGEATGDGDGEATGDGDGDSSSETGAATGDEHAEAACAQLLSGTPMGVASVATQVDANQVVLTPTNSGSYLVSLNEDGNGGYIGWVNMSVPDWGSTQAIFVGGGVEYELFRSEGMTPISKEINLACPETGHSDERVFFPHWADAQVRFTSSTESEAWFMFFKQN